MLIKHVIAAFVFALSPLALATTVQIEVTKEVKIQNDLMRVNFYALNEGSDPKNISEQNTKLVNQAIEKAKQTAGVEVAITGRVMSPVYGDKVVVKDGGEIHQQQIVGFQERVDISLTGQDMVAISKLMAELSSTLTLGGVDYTVTTDKRLEQEQINTDQTIGAFHEKARQITKAMGLQQYTVKSLHVSPLAGSPQYRPMMMKSEAMMANDSVMAAEGGNSTLQQSASGEIELNNKPYTIE